VYRKYNGRVHYVSISEAAQAGDLDYVATIHNGIDLTKFPLNEQPDDYLLFFSRILPEKGTVEAVEIARRSGMRLLIAGWILDQEYFDQKVKPLIDGDRVQYVGQVEPDDRAEVIGNAQALLNPILADEPYGTSVVESFACGTPVIAFNRGAMPELIQNEVNGFLVNDLADAVAAVRKIDRISRTECRETAQEHFSQARMVDEYIRVYTRILGKWGRDGKRPWGYYRVISDIPEEKVKRVVIEPGKRLSLQRHKYRSEHWYIVQGTARVICDGREMSLTPGQSVDIPVGAVHRIENIGSDELVFIEVQRGDYVGEDDIERLEDDYGRLPAREDLDEAV
jgi:mannose-6-phosphate isomerase-like protein (cupin superfamily)